MKHILCYGDSNTWGYDSRTNARFPFDTRWTGRLSALLPADYRIIEEGLCGRTTAYDLPLEAERNGYSTYRLALSCADPIDLVVVMLGTNDRRVQLHVSPEESALALERYILLTRSPTLWFGHQTPKLLLVAPPEISETVFETDVAFYYDANSVRHSRQIKSTYAAMAKRYNCDFLDAAAYCTPGPDGIHLDAAGHAALAQAMLGKIITIL